ncbi:hypothetical protein EIM48_11970 [Pseudoxanthomonas sp. SGNA-20]|nr:hypothetical protein EIM48_11970 [Pseudoxanthomonas sp. SGNA-20]
MRTFFWVIAMLSCVLAGLILVLGVATANGAPQEAAFAAIAVGVAVIPYCFARAISEISGPPQPPRVIPPPYQTPSAPSGAAPQG